SPTALVPGGALPLAFGIERPLPNTMAYSWGLSLQRQLSSTASVEVGYQGSRVVHDYQIVELNDATPGTAPRQQRRPYPGYQSIKYAAANGQSHYHGLEAKVEKRAGSSGLSGLSSFTWAKAIDTVGG